MSLLITELAIQANGTFALEITNTDPVNAVSTTDLRFVVEDSTGGIAPLLSSFGVPEFIPAGTAFTLGHTSIPGLSFYDATFNHAFFEPELVAIGSVPQLFGNPPSAIDSIGQRDEPRLGVDRVYASDTTRTPGTDFVNNDNRTDFTETTPFSTTGLDTTFCFMSGSLIATPQGERPVETLRIGDVVTTADGGQAPVLWIGRQTLRRRIGAVPERLEPVRIRAGAFGAGVPHSDLIVTADHGMVLDGLVINASALVNGDTIAYVPLSELAHEVTYYHVETQDHDIILANGAAAETFVDAVSRSKFDNYQEYLDLYGVERVIPEMQRSRISTNRLLPEGIRENLGVGSMGVDQADILSA